VNSFKKRERLPGDFNEFVSTLGQQDRDQLKFGRSINARKNWFKVFSGPIFKQIEHAVFSSVDREFGFSPFIKYVPVPQRTQVICDSIQRPGSFYVQTDHSAFEAHTTRELMECIEMPLYYYMTRNLPYGHVWYDIVHYVMTKSVWSVYKGKLKLRTEPMRYSGEMCTSLGNGWTNYVLMKFVLRTHNLMGRGFVEGDDGIFQVSGMVDAAWFKELGFNVKLEMETDLGRCGFCSLNFGPDGQNVREPREVLAGFGWSFSDCRHGGDVVCKGLLRSKAFSLLYEMPNCPILTAFALMVLRSTQGVPLRWDKHDVKYKSAQVYAFIQKHGENAVLKLANRECTTHQRNFVWEMYRVPASLQKQLEVYFDGISSVQRLESPLLQNLFPNLWYEYAKRYTYEVHAGISWNVVQLMQNI